MPIARHAWELGVRTFEVGSRGDPVALCLALGQSVPTVKTEGTVLIEASPGGAVFPGEEHARRARMASDVRELLNRCSAALGGRPRMFVELPFRDWAARDALHEPLATGNAELPLGGVLIASPESVAEATEFLARTPSLSASFAHNLLAPVPAALLDRIRAFGDRCFGRDPFAGGRLLGTRGSPNLTSDLSRPPTIDELERYWAPVTQLGFLAIRGRRTLSQAALLFCLQTMPKATILLDAPGPEQLDVLLAASRSPVLTPSELDQVLAFPSEEA